MTSEVLVRDLSGNPTNRDLSELRAKMLSAVPLSAHRRHMRTLEITHRSIVLFGLGKLEAAPSDTRENPEVRTVGLGKSPKLQVDRIRLTKRQQRQRQRQQSP